VLGRPFFHLTFGHLASVCLSIGREITDWWLARGPHQRGQPIFEPSASLCANGLPTVAQGRFGEDREAPHLTDLPHVATLRTWHRRRWPERFVLRRSKDVEPRSLGRYASVSSSEVSNETSIESGGGGGGTSSSHPATSPLESTTAFGG
jgi:hypothetical protein